MKKEMKICLQGYKLAYSMLFMMILSLVRGITTYDEIGITIEPYLAILAVIFCADTYMCEWNAKRGDIFAFISRKNRKKVIYRRLTIQILYLWILGAVGYFLFFWQKPISYGPVSIGKEYGVFLLVLFGNVLFWSVLSMTISNLTRNHIIGIGSSVLLWLALYSKWGEAYLGKYNVFSYVFRDGFKDGVWICGSVVGIILTILFLGMIPLIMKKRG